MPVRRRTGRTPLRANNDEILWEIKLGFAGLRQMLDTAFAEMANPGPHYENSPGRTTTQKVTAPAREGRLEGTASPCS